MTATDATIECFIDELRHSVITAELNYQIWWVYKEKASRQRFASTMNRYSPFFQTGIHAHFVAYLISIYRLHEKRRDTVNIPHFVEMIEKTGILQAQTIATARKFMAQAKPLWVKAGILRNELFAHRAKTHDIAEVFRKASVKPDELVRLNLLTKQMLNGITSHWNKTAHIFEVDAGKAAARLLEDLRKLSAK